MKGTTTKTIKLTLTIVVQGDVIDVDNYLAKDAMEQVNEQFHKIILLSGQPAWDWDVEVAT